MLSAQQSVQEKGSCRGAAKRAAGGGRGGVQARSTPCRGWARQRSLTPGCCRPCRRETIPGGGARMPQGLMAS